jgi:hypothetical protein
MFSNLWNAVGKAVFDDVFDDQQSRDDAPAMDSSSQEPTRALYSFAVPTSSSSESALELSAKYSDDLTHNTSSQGSKMICFTVSVPETVNTPDGLRPRPSIGDLRKTLGVGDEEVVRARGKEIAADLPYSTAAQKLSFEHVQEADLSHLISAPDALDSSGSFNSDQFFSFINDEGLADDATALNDAPSRPSVDNSPYSYQFGLDTPPQDRYFAKSPREVFTGETRTAVGKLVALRESARRGERNDPSTSPFHFAAGFSSSPNRTSPLQRNRANQSLRSQSRTGVLDVTILSCDDPTSCEGPNVATTDNRGPALRSTYEFDPIMIHRTPILPPRKEGSSEIAGPDSMKKTLMSTMFSPLRFDGHGNSNVFETIDENMSKPSTDPDLPIVDRGDESSIAASPSSIAKGEKCRNPPASYITSREMVDCRYPLNSVPATGNRQATSRFESNLKSQLGGWIQVAGNENQCSQPDTSIALALDDHLWLSKQHRSHEILLLNVVEQLQDNVRLIFDVQTCQRGFAADGPWLVSMSESGLWTGLDRDSSEAVLNHLSTMLAQVYGARTTGGRENDHVSCRALSWCRSVVQLKAVGNSRIDHPGRWEARSGLGAVLGMTQETDPTPKHCRRTTRHRHRGGDTSVFTPPYEPGSEGVDTPTASNLSSCATTISSVAGSAHCGVKDENGRTVDGLYIRETVQIIASLIQELSFVLTKIPSDSPTTNSDSGNRGVNEITRIYQQLMQIPIHDIKTLVNAFVWCDADNEELLPRITLSSSSEDTDDLENHPVQTLALASLSPRGQQSRAVPGPPPAEPSPPTVGYSRNLFLSPSSDDMRSFRQFYQGRDDGGRREDAGFHDGYPCNEINVEQETDDLRRVVGSYDEHERYHEGDLRE